MEIDIFFSELPIDLNVANATSLAFLHPAMIC